MIMMKFGKSEISFPPHPLPFLELISVLDGVRFFVHFYVKTLQKYGVETVRLYKVENYFFNIQRFCI